MVVERSARARPAYRLVAGRLREAGFTTFFGLMGEDTARLTTALVEHGARYVSARQETTAVSMADGYARATAGVGLCVVSRGPGLLNALGAATSADRAGTALLLVAGDAPVDANGGRPAPAADLKAMDQLAAASAAGLPAIRPGTAGELPSALDEALALAARGRAVLLSLPVNLLDAIADCTALPPPTAVRQTVPPVQPDTAALDQVAARLGAARRVLLLAGAGAVSAGAGPAIEALALRTGSLLGTSLAAKDLFAGRPGNLGIVGGFSDAIARAQLEAVDLVVAFGASLNRFTTAAGALMPEGGVVQVDSDRSRLGLLHPVALGVWGDTRLAAEGLLARLPGDGVARQERPPRNALIDRDRYTDRSSPTTVDPRTLLRALDALLPPERNIVVDCGHFAGFPAQYLRVAGPERFFWSLHFGMLGLGLGLGVGVALARPDEPTVTVVGDGGLLMTLGELETLARVRPRLILVVLDDGAYAAEKHFLELHGEEGDLAVFGNGTDFAGMAVRLGLRVATIRSPADLEPLANALAAGIDPLVLDCKVPLVRAGWYEEMLTGRYPEQ